MAAVIGRVGFWVRTPSQGFSHLLQDKAQKEGETSVLTYCLGQLPAPPASRVSPPFSHLSLSPPTPPLPIPPLPFLLLPEQAVNPSQQTPQASSCDPSIIF